jgi:hypothetical protein
MRSDVASCCAIRSRIRFLLCLVVPLQSKVSKKVKKSVIFGREEVRPRLPASLLTGLVLIVVQPNLVRSKFGRIRSEFANLCQALIKISNQHSTFLWFPIPQFHTATSANAKIRQPQKALKASCKATDTAPKLSEVPRESSMPVPRSRIPVRSRVFERN